MRPDPDRRWQVAVGGEIHFLTVSDLKSFLDILVTYGVAPVLVLGLIILGREYRRKEHECARWQRLALSALTDTAKAAEIAEFFRGEK